MEGIILMGSYSRGQISRCSSRTEAGGEVGGGGAEVWEGWVQIDCLQRAAVPLACFTSPLSAALVFPLTRENRGEKDRENRRER